MNGKQGFTLIELLIVVAIIGILAAIAVPNFLNAQVRSKVAATRAEFSSSATALRTYQLDFNRLPPMSDRGIGVRHYRLPSFLTTPVAYMQSMPDDTFQMLNDPLRNSNNTDENILSRYRYHDIPQLIKDRDTYDIPAKPADMDVFGGWRIISIGPDMEYQGYTPYNSSNGIVSRGDVYLSEKGEGSSLPSDVRVGSGSSL